jgi:hypothetical protein
MNGAVMKSVLNKLLTSTCLLFLVSSVSTPAARAQDVKLQLSNLDRLETKASQSVDVTLDGQMLRLAISFLRSDKPKEKAIKEMVAGLKGIYVKLLQFEKEGEYTPSDIDSVRTQLRAPAWSRMVEVKTKREGDNIEVYSMQAAGQINGMAVILTSPKRLAVVNIVGMIDLEKLTQLSGTLGIPSIEITINEKDPKE